MWNVPSRRCIRVRAAALILLTHTAACRDARETAGLLIDLEKQYPGSRVSLEDTRAESTRRIDVTIEASSFDASAETDLAEDARRIAGDVARRYDLGERDTVTVSFRSERRTGPFTSSQTIRIVYPVAGIASTG